MKCLRSKVDYFSSAEAWEPAVGRALPKTSNALVATLMFSVALLVGCGEDAEPSNSGPITSRSQLLDATIRIVARGTFVPPGDLNQYEVAGSGSGFIIDPRGIAVTNNHVVTGAGSLQVFLGDRATPINARVLGVSECNDLAVIDLEGDGYRYLEWYDGPIERGLDVLSVGFPLGTSSLTETEGTLSTVEHPEDTPWASVQSILEHSARIRPGNSGGPLVTLDGLRVIGVNYAGNSENDQNLAISVNVARGLATQLEADEDVLAVGINGVAIDGVGVWAQSIAPGSPADVTGLEPGDIVTSLAGVSPADAGTLRNYCDVLRTQGTEATINIEVIRSSTNQVFGGQLNGMPFPAMATTTVSVITTSGESTPATPTAPPVATGTGDIWARFQLQAGGDVCGVVNGANFEAVILEPSGELMVISNADAVQTGVLVADTGVVTLEGQQTGFEVVWATDSDGLDRLWIVDANGNSLALDETGVGAPPAEFSNVPCDACPQVDNPDPSMMCP